MTALNIERPPRTPQPPKPDQEPEHSPGGNPTQLPGDRPVPPLEPTDEPRQPYPQRPIEEPDERYPAAPANGTTLQF